MWFDPGSKPAGKHTCMCKTAVTKVTAVLLGLALYRKSKKWLVKVKLGNG